MRAVIDADVLVYQSCLAATTPAEHEIHGDVVITDWLSTTEAELVFDNLAEAIRDQTEATSLMFCLSDSANYRKELYPAYKANRKGRRPLGWSYMRGYCTDKYGGFSKPTLEGDDLVGMYGSEPGSIIVSIDKDLRTVPGLHLDMAVREVIEVNADEANLTHMVQTLTGDSTDNYPGCPGLGKVRAARLLETCHTPLQRWEAVVGAYLKAGESATDALTQARLAYILRSPSEYHLDTGVALWTPPTT